MSRRIAVTGIGLITSVGEGKDAVWNSLLAGKSGITPFTSFDTSLYKVHLGGEVPGFSAAKHVRNQDPEEMGRASQMAIGAAYLALEDAGLGPSTFPSHRVGVVMGTTSGEPQEVERFNDHWVGNALDDVGPEFMERYPCHKIPAQVAAELGVSGFNMMIPAACAAGNYAVAQAYDTLRAGRADMMLAGGADSFSRITYTGFARLGAIAPGRCQPFDSERQGMVPGEGAAMLVLEPLEAAQKRGAVIYAEVAGYGLSCDAHHMTAAHPEGDGAARAMEQALRTSGIQPSEVGYISAHGTGTPTNDKLETIALEKVFGKRAGGIPVSSIKSMLGHTMGAASAIEAAVCSLAVHTGRIPPTVNFENPDPECDLDCVPNVAREVPVEIAMNNAYAFGGNNASVLFRRVEGS